MKSTPRPPEPYDGSGCACGTINNYLARVRAQSHFEKSTNDLKMGRGKRAGRWRAVVWPHTHIDDGSMGGGGPIPHDDVINYDSETLEIKWGKGWTYSGIDIVYGTNPHFSKERRHIFHYCIFGHEIKAEGKTDWDGYSEIGGDDLNIADNNMDWFHEVEDQAQTFAHELGHNLGLDCPCSNWCAMRHGYEPTSYCSDCWDDIDLTLFTTSGD